MSEPIPVSEPIKFSFAEMTSSFSGADIKAYIIRRDDPIFAKRAADYLNDLYNSNIQSQDNPEIINFGTTPLVNPTINPSQADNIEDDGQEFDPENLVPLINLTAITCSTFRSKSQVRALGHVNPRGIARGSRTIGGTIIVTEFDRDVFWSLISGQDPVPGGDSNIGDQGGAVLPDQVVPFDILLIFSNESGMLSYRVLYEIELVTNGVVYSIQDMYNENTLSFLCTDVSPLTPLSPIVLQDPTGRFTAVTSAPSINPLASVTSGREVLRRFRLQKNSRFTNI